MLELFIHETYGDAVFVKCPHLLDQLVIQLLRPLALEKSDNGLTSLKELGAIAPAAVFRVGLRHAFGIACIPGGFGHAGLLSGAFGAERRTWGTAGHESSSWKMVPDFGGLP